MHKSFFYAWWRQTEGVAAMESALIFPLLLVMLLGTFDLGNGILVNQKVIRSSQVVADLITREQIVSDADISEAIEGGQMALVPYPTTTFGIDVVSIEFDDDAEGSILWRETRNMTPDPDVLQRVESLAEPNNGVVVVFVRYLFEPVFAGFVVDNISMEEIAFARGRLSPAVQKR